MLCANVFAQGIVGKVMDAKTRESIIGAVVKTDSATHVAVTGKDGSFELANLSTEVYLQVTCIGYNPVRIKGKVGKELSVYMTPVTSQLGEVVTSELSKENAEIKEIRQNIMPVTVISSKQIENRAGNLNEILARQAGVQIRLSGGLGSTARISVRGLEGKRVQVFIDGNPLNTPDGSLGINDLPVQIIERIEIYKGSVPAYLGGDGLGSAVNVVLKHRDVSYIDANISRQSYNTQLFGLILKKTFDKQGIEIGGGIFDTRSDNNYKMLSPYQPGLTIKRDHDRYHSLLTGGALRFHKLWFDEIEIEGAYVLNDKEIQGIQKNIQHVESKGAAGVIALNMSKKNFAKNKLGLNYHFVRVNFKINFIDTSSYSYDWDGKRSPSLFKKGEMGIGPNLSTTLQNETRQRINLDYRLHKKLTLNLNNTFRYGTFDPKDDLANSFAGQNLFNYPGSLMNSVTGLTFESKLFESKLLLSASGKHYYNFTTGYNTNIYLTASPEKIKKITNIFGYNAGFRYNITKYLFFKYSYERGVRLPLNAELFGDGALITPAIALKPELSYNHSAGLIFDWFTPKNNRIQVDINGFYMNVDQLIQLAGNGLSLGYVNYAKANIIGADVDIKSDITSFLFINYNATIQKITDANKYTPGTNNVPNPTYELTIPNTPLLFSNWSIEFHKDQWKNTRMSTRIIYDGSYVQQYNYGFKISVYDNFIIPTYLIHTMSVEHSFRNQRYTISAEVNNITDKPVLNNFNQPLPGRTFRVKLRFLLLGKDHVQHSENTVK